MLKFNSKFNTKSTYVRLSCTDNDKWYKVVKINNTRVNIKD